MNRQIPFGVLLMVSVLRLAAEDLAVMKCEAPAVKPREKVDWPPTGRDV